MTVDERLEFLLHSTESLHASVQGLHADAQGLHAGAKELREIVNRIALAVEADGQHIRALVRVAELHDRRLTNLEGASDAERGE